jgi:hypothetical protein
VQNLIQIATLTTAAADMTSRLLFRQIVHDAIIQPVSHWSRGCGLRAQEVISPWNLFIELEESVLHYPLSFSIDGKLELWQCR